MTGIRAVAPPEAMTGMGPPQAALLGAASRAGVPPATAPPPEGQLAAEPLAAAPPVTAPRPEAQLGPTLPAAVPLGRLPTAVARPRSGVQSKRAWLREELLQRRRPRADPLGVAP